MHVIEEEGNTSNLTPVPVLDESYGGTQDLILLGYEINEISESIKIKFRRKMDTKDKFDRKIKK